MNVRFLKLGVVLIVALALFAGLNLTLDAVQAAQDTERPVSDLGLVPHAFQIDPPAKFPVITDTVVGKGPEISGGCVAFRDGNGRVYLHNRTSGETITVTDKTEPGSVRKVVVSQGIVVWGSDRPGETGLWGYYNPSCSDASIFGAEIITPFYIVSRPNAHAPALSGEMLTFDTWHPAGAWYIRDRSAGTLTLLLLP